MQLQGRWAGATADTGGEGTGDLEALGARRSATLELLPVTWHPQVQWAAPCCWREV